MLWPAFVILLSSGKIINVTSFKALQLLYDQNNWNVNHSVIPFKQKLVNGEDEMREWRVGYKKKANNLSRTGEICPLQRKK